MNDNAEYPRTCSTCGRTYRDHEGWMEHIRMGHVLAHCECGGKRIKMTLPDSTSRTGPHVGWRTVRFCPSCKTAICWTTRDTGVAHGEQVEGADLARLIKQYESVAARLGASHA